MGEAAAAALNLIPLLAFQAFTLFAYRKAPLASFVRGQALGGIGAIVLSLAFDGLGGLSKMAVVPGVLVAATAGRFLVDARRRPDPPPRLPLDPLPPAVEQNVHLLDDWMEGRAVGATPTSGRTYRMTVDLTFAIPPERLFSLIAEFARWGEWPGRSSSAVRLSAGTWGRGARYRQDLNYRGVVYSSVCAITAFDPPTTFDCASVSAGSLVSEAHHEIRPTPDGGSLLRVQTTLHLRSRGTPVDALLWPMQSAFNRHDQLRTLRRFKAWAEPYLAHTPGD